MSESQRVMRWRLILEEFGPNIESITGVDNTIADTLSRHPSANIEDDNDFTDTEGESSGATKIKQLYIARNNNDDVAFPLTLSLVYDEQQLESQNANSKINTY